MNCSLRCKLTIAFAVTAVIGILLAAILIDRATAAAFNRYLQRAADAGNMMRGMAAMMGLPERTFLHAMRGALMTAAIAAVGLSALVAVFLSQQITAPLRRLSTAASRVAHGDLSCRVPVDSNDEVGSLAGTFNGMVDSLERNQDARRNLMADLAHEMSSPLSVVQSNLEAMLDGVVEPSQSNISSLHEETLLLSRLVRDLRTLSQVESGRLALAPVPSDVSSVVKSVAQATEPEARRRNISLAIDVAPGLPQAVIDPDRMSQVIGNLLSNALRYTSEGGYVRIGVAPYHASGNGTSAVVVSVADTGQGIPEMDLPRIFDRYFRGSQAKDGRAGSGIGLAVVKELVEAHKGKVWVESQPGKGSTFFFTVPTVPAAA